MSYTAKGLREQAELDELNYYRRGLGQERRAHADALEELAALRAQLAERDAEIKALRERAERNEKDCEAAKLYGSMGFFGVPAWAELAEDTKDIYRRAAKDGALGK